MRTTLKTLARYFPESVILLFLMMGASGLAHAQIKFENGYYRDNTGTVVPGLIQNMGWFKNPGSIKYKATESSHDQELPISQISEFVVGSYKFIRATVKIDTSNQDAKDMTHEKQPEWDTRELLLRVIVEGKMTLYQYRSDKLLKYFYSTMGGPIEQLVYKSYVVPVDRPEASGKGGVVATNLTYVQQLLNNVNCKNMNVDRMKKVKYKEDDLIPHFVNHNKCAGGESKVMADSQKPTEVVWSMYGGPQRTTVVMFTTNRYRYSGARGGIGSEFILPFGQKKWSIPVGIGFQLYKGEDRNFSVDYQAIELMAGFRHYFYLSDRNRLFLNAGLFLDKPIKGQFDKWTATKSELNVGVGGGYAWKRWSVEARYHFPKGVFDDGFLPSVRIEYSKLGLVLGYTL